MRLAILAAALLASPQCWAQHAGERLPACVACHGSNGQPAASGAPVLGGQPPDYLLVQLLMFREKQRQVPAMNAVAAGLRGHFGINAERLRRGVGWPGQM